MVRRLAGGLLSIEGTSTQAGSPLSHITKTRYSSRTYIYNKVYGSGTKYASSKTLYNFAFAVGLSISVFSHLCFKKLTKTICHTEKFSNFVP